MFYQQPYNQINEYTKKLKLLIGSTVQCNFGGPEEGRGILLKVGFDYCVLQCNEGVYYYPLHHIKGYKLIQKDDDSKKSSEDPVIVSGLRFVDVLDRLKGQKVQFNKGPNKVKGIVVGRDENHVRIEVNDEVLYVSTFHIQNMCWDDCDPKNN